MEEKPDVTYSDVGGCKEQIEKLREVVETPLLHVSIHKCTLSILTSHTSIVTHTCVSLFSSPAREVCQFGHRAA